MNREPFYAEVTKTLFFGSLPQWQKEPLDAIINECLRRERSLTECAYSLATPYYETGRFKYSEEIGKGSGKAYGQAAPLMGTGSKVQEWRTYYGRSWPQHTWLQNYAKLSIRASLEFQREIDFVSHPDLLLSDKSLEAWALLEGLVSGMWTGKNFADFRKADGTLDYLNARQIVNGMDHADEIAGYAEQFEAALLLIEEDTSNITLCPLHNQLCPLGKKG